MSLLAAPSARLPPCALSWEDEGEGRGEEGGRRRIREREGEGKERGKERVEEEEEGGRGGWEGRNRKGKERERCKHSLRSPQLIHMKLGLGQQRIGR